MDDTSKKNWGIYGSCSAVVGIISCFVPGFPALFVGFVAVILGFLGSRKHQTLSQTGILVGGFTVFFANIVNMGTIPIQHFVNSDRGHFIESIHESNRAFVTLKGRVLSDLSRKELLQHLRYSLDEASKVNIANVDRQVTGFSTHYEDEFIAGMESLIQGYENDNDFMKLQGGTLLDKWAIWNQNNRKNLEKIKKPELSFFSFLYESIIS